MQSKNTILIIVFLLLISSIVVFAAEVSTIEVSFTVDNGGIGALGSWVYAAQTFNHTGTAFVVSIVGVKLEKLNNPSTEHNISLSIWNVTAAGDPNILIEVCPGTLNSASVSVPSNWSNFTGCTTTIDPNTDYAVALNHTGFDGTNRIMWRGDTGSGYLNGDGRVSNDGLAWTDVQDTAFIIYSSITESVFQVTASDNYTGSAINNFTVILWNSTTGNAETVTTTNGTAKFVGYDSPSNYSVNITSTHAFNLTIFDFDVSNNLGMSLYQSIITFEARELLSNDTINTFTASDPVNSKSTTTGAAILFLTAGQYNITGVSGGFFNTTTNITVNPLDQFNATLSFGSTNYTVLAKEFFSNVSLQNFSVTVIAIDYPFTQTINTTSFAAGFTIVNGTYNVTVSASDFVSQTQQIEITSVEQNDNFFLLSQNSILITLIDEDTDEIIDDQTFNIDFRDSQLAFVDTTFTTANGTLFIQNLNPATYIIEPFNANYDRRTYFVTIVGGEHVNIDIRMLNNTDGKDVQITIIDFNSRNPIEGATVTVTKRINLSLVTVDQDISDATGITNFVMKATTQYTLLISHPNYITRTVGITPSADEFEIALFQETPFDFTTVFSRFTYLTRPISTTITPSDRDFNITVSCTILFPGCLQYFGIQFNSTLFDNITASPGGGTAAISLTVVNTTTEYEFTYFIKATGFGEFRFTQKYFTKDLIVTGNQSFMGITEEYDDYIPDWFKPFIAVIVALVFMVGLSKFTQMTPTSLGVIGLFIETFFAIIGWIPRVVIFLIWVLVIFTWLRRDRGEF